jgi:hypothetical protein
MKHELFAAILRSLDRLSCSDAVIQPSGMLLVRMSGNYIKVSDIFSRSDLPEIAALIRSCSERLYNCGADGLMQYELGRVRWYTPRTNGAVTSIIMRLYSKGIETEALPKWNP